MFVHNLFQLAFIKVSDSKRASSTLPTHFGSSPTIGLWSGVNDSGPHTSDLMPVFSKEGQRFTACFQC